MVRKQGLQAVRHTRTALPSLFCGELPSLLTYTSLLGLCRESRALSRSKLQRISQEKQRMVNQEEATKIQRERERETCTTRSPDCLCTCGYVRQTCPCITRRSYTANIFSFQQQMIISSFVWIYSFVFTMIYYRSPSPPYVAIPC
jgi:hypothetical protein